MWKNNFEKKFKKDPKQLINYNKFNYQHLQQSPKLKENKNNANDNYSSNNNDTDNNNKSKKGENKSLELEMKKISFKEIFVYLKPYISKVKPLIFYSIGLTVLSKVFVSLVRKKFTLLFI